MKIHLSDAQFKIFVLLFRNLGSKVEDLDLYIQLYPGDEDRSLQNISVQMVKLRQKLQQYFYITRVRPNGWRMDRLKLKS